ncbi:hypothetical protein YQE_11429, partial [Dendroctonus ponderosae]
MAVLQRSFQKNMVNELEEVVLKKLVYELRIKMTDIRGIYIKELERWQTKIVKCQHNLTKEIKENTKRLELVAVINKEKKDLARFVDTQDKRRERVAYMEAIHCDFTKDLDKLEEIVNDQNQTIQDLKEETRMLKTKGSAQEVRKRSQRMADYEKPRSEKELVKEEMTRWIDYEDYVSDVEWDEEEELEEEQELLRTDITIPTYQLLEGEDLVKELIDTLMKDVDADLTRKSNEDLVHEILSNIVKCSSTHAMINEIIDNLPIGELNEEQRSNIEETAEKLMSIQEPQVNDENVLSCIKDILEEVLEEVVCADPHYLIPAVLEKLLDNLPVEMISSESALDEIALSITKSVQDLELNQDELRKSVESISSADQQEIAEIINGILERVYGEGIGYFYVINS